MGASVQLLGDEAPSPSWAGGGVSTVKRSKKVQHKQYNCRTDLPFVYSHRAAAHQYVNKRV